MFDGRPTKWCSSAVDPSIVDIWELGGHISFSRSIINLRHTLICKNLI